MTTGRREAGGGIAEARREIRGRGILRGRGMRGHDDLTGNEIDDVIAIGIGEHPAGRERVGEMTGPRGVGLIRDKRRECEQTNDAYDKTHLGAEHSASTSGGSDRNFGRIISDGD